MILQLDPPLWLETPHGEMLAHLVQDVGVEHELLWTGFLTETGQCWTFQNSRIRASRNIMMGRVHPEKPTKVRLSEYSDGRPAATAAEPRLEPEGGARLPGVRNGQD